MCIRDRILADDFSLYLHAPTRTDPSLAPPGCECFYVLSPVPNLGGKVDWNAMKAVSYTHLFQVGINFNNETHRPARIQETSLMAI